MSQRLTLKLDARNTLACLEWPARQLPGGILGRKMARQSDGDKLRRLPGTFRRVSLLSPKGVGGGQTKSGQDKPR